MTDETPPPPEGAPSPEELKRALKAFKKRLKLTRLDAESKMGYGPTSGTGKTTILAITPPDQYPPAVWQELVRQKKLKYDVQGMYKLVEGA